MAGADGLVNQCIRAALLLLLLLLRASMEVTPVMGSISATGGEVRTQRRTSGRSRAR